MVVETLELSSIYSKNENGVSMSTDPESRRDFGPYLEGVGPTFVNEEGDTQMIQSFLMRI